MEPDLIGQEKAVAQLKPAIVIWDPQWSLTSSVRKRSEEFLHAGDV